MLKKEESKRKVVAKVGETTDNGNEDNGNEEERIAFEIGSLLDGCGA
jgi:hypothetical protein